MMPVVRDMAQRSLRFLAPDDPDRRLSHGDNDRLNMV